MAQKNIAFDSTVTFTGRNGTFKQNGVAINRYDSIVEFVPVTSKGELGRCAISIPFENLPDIILALNQIALNLPGNE